ncbi:MAG TPA: hypothetical protein VFQ35_05085 [Polyangiaceae bacterium]|nr:hypothetical protein [Polyangiaceae bacterium]
MNLRLGLPWILLACGALLAPTPARGDDATPPDANDSAKVFADAVKTFKAGRAKDALPSFERVAAATKSPNAELYVGYCLAELGRHREAHKAFSLTIRYALALKDPRYEAARESAQDQVLGLNLRLARLVLSFVDAPAGLNVLVDEQPVPADELGSPIVLDPGAHHIRATADGAQPIERDETIEAGGSKTLTLSFAKNTANPEKTVVVLPSRSSESTLRMLGFVTGGVAVAGLSVFAITGLKARSIHSQLESECARGCSDASHLDMVGRGKSMQTVANVSLAIGAVSAAASATLLYFGYRQTSTPEAAVAVEPGGLSLHYRGTF